MIPRAESKNPKKKADLLVNTDDHAARVGEKLERRSTNPEEINQVKKKEKKVSKKKESYEE